MKVVAAKLKSLNATVKHLTSENRILHSKLEKAEEKSLMQEENYKKQIDTGKSNKKLLETISRLEKKLEEEKGQTAEMKMFVSKNREEVDGKVLVLIIKFVTHTVEPQYNAVVWAHKMPSLCSRISLYVLSILNVGIPRYIACFHFKTIFKLIFFAVLCGLSR